MPTRAETALARVRALCLSFPGATERPSHGAPTFFVGKKSFLTFVDNHHGDARLDRKAPWAVLAKTIEDAYATRASSKPARTGRR